MQQPRSKQTCPALNLNIALPPIVFLIIVSVSNAYPQAGRNYFYKGLQYGSDAIYNPISTILNGGFGIIQLGNRDRKILNIDYRTGWKNVWDNILHPVKHIRAYGTGKFVRNEIVPTSFSLKHAQFWPNYQNHLIGGGMTYRAMREWFEMHKYPHSPAWALTSTMVYHLLNEVVENNSFQGTNVDPIADLLIFNPLSVLLFSSDKVSRFFGENLNLRDWSFFPAYNPANQTLENNGQNYAIKIRLNVSTPWHLFYNFGNHGIVGLSYRGQNGRSISFGGGFMARDLVKVSTEDNIQKLTTELVWNAGLFYDRNHSLLASFILSGARAYKGRLTIYPGVIRVAGISPALFAALDSENNLIAGIYLTFFPIGIAAQ